mmetsp:Transcript_147203/g.257115  ORF Transcript_147203/g.257115 Transcript_147203/m.257115 type:complete len:418 (-) Transcript_147203:340-1593(-)
MSLSVRFAFTCFSGAKASGAAFPNMSIVRGFAGADGPDRSGWPASMRVTGWSEGFSGLRSLDSGVFSGCSGSSLASGDFGGESFSIAAASPSFIQSSITSSSFSSSESEKTMELLLVDKRRSFSAGDGVGNPSDFCWAGREGVSPASMVTALVSVLRFDVDEDLMTGVVEPLEESRVDVPVPLSSVFSSTSWAAEAVSEEDAVVFGVGDSGAGVASCKGTGLPGVIWSAAEMDLPDEVADVADGDRVTVAGSARKPARMEAGDLEPGVEGWDPPRLAGLEVGPGDPTFRLGMDMAGDPNAPALGRLDTREGFMDVCRLRGTRSLGPVGSGLATGGGDVPILGVPAGFGGSLEGPGRRGADVFGLVSFLDKGSLSSVRLKRLSSSSRTRAAVRPVAGLEEGMGCWPGLSLLAPLRGVL